MQLEGKHTSFSSEQPLDTDENHSFLYSVTSVIISILEHTVQPEKSWFVSIRGMGVYFVDCDSKSSVFDSRKI